MFTKHVYAPATLKAAGSEEGSLEAVFSTFHTIDLDGDVTLPGAFTDGQEVPLVWSHDWSNPIGKGRIRVERNRAVFVGRFWLDTQAGTEAYRRVKNAGGMQEYSYGYQVLDSDLGERDGQRVRFLKRVDVFEVSPVLVGAAGRGNTRTLAVKEGRQLSEANRARLRAIRDGLAAQLADVDALLGDADAGKGRRLSPGDVALIEWQRTEARLNGVRLDAPASREEVARAMADSLITEARLLGVRV